MTELIESSEAGVSTDVLAFPTKNRADLLPVEGLTRNGARGPSRRGGLTTRSDSSRRTLVAVVGLTTLLHSIPAHALPTPDAVIGVVQLAPLVVSVVGGAFAAFGVRFASFIDRRPN